MFFKDATPETKKLIYRLVFLMDEIDKLKDSQHSTEFEYDQIATTIDVLRGQIEGVKKALSEID